MGEKIPKNPIREHNKYWLMASTQLKNITVVKLEIFPQIGVKIKKNETIKEIQSIHHLQHH